MIHTIRLDRILQDAVATPYRDLVTRPTGVAVRNGVQNAMDRARCLTALLDFSAVGLLDFSCADEIVAKLLLDWAPEREHYVLLIGLSEDHREAIDHVLRNHNLVMAALAEPDEPPFLLGAIAGEPREAFQHIHRDGPCTLSSLAGSKAWPFETAAGALQDLSARRLVRERSGVYHPLPVQ